MAKDTVPRYLNQMAVTIGYFVKTAAVNICPMMGTEARFFLRNLILQTQETVKRPSMAPAQPVLSEVSLKYPKYLSRYAIIGTQ